MVAGPGEGVCRALLFPGQGSQYVGMARELALKESEARRTLDEADDVLGFPLSELMAAGPAEELTETRNAQPAILTHSVAVLRVLGRRLGDPAMAAGHSLGEFSAHVAAGTLSFPDALRAVRRRGELMFTAGDERPGTMAAVLGMDESSLTRVLESVRSGTCVAANFNAPGQTVISGDASAVREAAAALGDAGAKRVVPLPVSGAFHSPLMRPAAEELEGVLARIEFKDPVFPVVSNVTARPIRDGEQGRALLVEQLTSPVRWSESVWTMLSAGVNTFAEVGPGKVLAGISRRIARRVPCIALGDPADLARLAA